MENKIAIYQSEDGLVKIDVHLEDDSVWLSQAQNVSLHINNAIADAHAHELDLQKCLVLIQSLRQRTLSR
jgi:hypothetical protein